MIANLATLRAFFAAAPFMVDLGVEPTTVDNGRVSTQLVLHRRHLQHTGQVHAGVSAALADHTMGAAAQTLVPDDGLVITAELKTSLLRPASGERLVCEARVLKPGRNLMFTEAEVYAEQGGDRRLVAKASATMAVVQPRR